MKFNKFFENGNAENAARDKFIARLMGIFNEEIIKIWCKHKNSPYKNLGSPTVRRQDDPKGKYSTLDFALKDKTGNIYVAESKCLLQYQKYQHLELNNMKQIDRYEKNSTKRAFQWLLELSKHPKKFILNINNKEGKIKMESQIIAGGILIWASVNEKFRKILMKERLFKDVLSLETIINDLIKWESEEFNELLDQKSKWVYEFISFLRKAENM